MEDRSSNLASPIGSAEKIRERQGLLKQMRHLLRILELRQEGGQREVGSSEQGLMREFLETEAKVRQLEREL